MILYLALQPLAPAEVGSGRGFAFNDAWLWPVLLFATVFIGYLCVDAWIIRQRNRRINEMKQRARSAVQAEAARR